MTISKGEIIIDSVKGTITINMENGAYVREHFPNGIAHWLEDEIDTIRTYGLKDVHPQVPPKGWESTE